MRRAATLVLTLACACVPAAPPSRAAEAGIEVLSTDGNGNETSLDMEQRSMFAPPASASARFRSNAGRETTVRLSASAGDSPWTGDVGFGWLETDNPELSLDIVQLHLDAGLRTPALIRRPDGRGLRGHVLAGLVIAGIDGEARLTGMRVPVSIGEWLVATDTPVVAPRLAIGLEWRFAPRIALLAEYHRCRLDFDGMATNSWILPTQNTFARGSIATDGLGIGLRWFIADGPHARESPP